MKKITSPILFILLLVSVQVNASLINGANSHGLFSIDIGTGNVDTITGGFQAVNNGGIALNAIENNISVPEPSALLLLLSGIIGLGFARRSKTQLI